VASTGSLKDKVIESISTPAVPPAAPDMKPGGPATFSEPAVTYPDTKPVADVPLPPIPTAEVPAPPAEKVVEIKPEVQAELPAEQPAETPTPKKSATTTIAPAATPAVAPAPVAEKTEVRRQIESILQGGLTDMYMQMQPAERAAFSKSANETASKLELLVSQFKANAREVLAIIRAWLTKIPRVNKYFLEQSSKIKTDEILEVQRQAKKRSRLIH
jgi:hypothetical protein